MFFFCFLYFVLPFSVYVRRHSLWPKCPRLDARITWESQSHSRTPDFLKGYSCLSLYKAKRYWNISRFFFSIIESNNPPQMLQTCQMPNTSQQCITNPREGHWPLPLAADAWNHLWRHPSKAGIGSEPSRCHDDARKQCDVTGFTHAIDWDGACRGGQVPGHSVSQCR